LVSSGFDRCWRVLLCNSAKRNEGDRILMPYGLNRGMGVTTYELQKQKQDDSVELEVA
jgi:hypothetical protein